MISADGPTAAVECEQPLTDTCDHCGAKGQLLCLYGAYVCEDCYEEIVVDRDLCDVN
jgi:hypothetical protein